MLKLYIGNKNYSSWSMRPWVLMKQENIAFEEIKLRFDAFSREGQTSGRSACEVLSASARRAKEAWDTIRTDSARQASPADDKSCATVSRSGAGHARMRASRRGQASDSARAPERGIASACRAPSISGTVPADVIGWTRKKRSRMSRACAHSSAVTSGDSCARDESLTRTKVEFPAERRARATGDAGGHRSVWSVPSGERSSQ